MPPPYEMIATLEAEDVGAVLFVLTKRGDYCYIVQEKKGHWVYHRGFEVLGLDTGYPVQAIAFGHEDDTWVIM